MRALAILFGAAVLAATPTWACSPVPGYRVPSNYTLVRDADLVVFGRIKSGPSVETLIASRDGSRAPQVLIEPLRALKGSLPTDALKVEGYVSIKGKAFGPNPTPLYLPHPSTFMGACIRQQYAVGALVVAVFHRTDKGWKQEESPFARSVEDVEGLRGAWVRAAETYATIAALPTMEARRAAMEREIARLLRLQDDSAAPAIAADLQTELRDHD